MNHAEKVKELTISFAEATVQYENNGETPGDWVTLRAIRAQLHAAIDEMQAEIDRLKAALSLAGRMCNEALPKFNWGASALDANAIDLLNRAPMAIDAAMKERAEMTTAIADAKELSGPVCPTCGSNCNERDELIKAEREIERLRGSLAEQEAQPSPADVPLPPPPGAFHASWSPPEKEVIFKYGQACAKAARDAAFGNAKCSSFCAKSVRDAAVEECADLLESMYSETSEAVGPHPEPYYDGWLAALDVATTRIQTAKKGTT